MGVRDYAFSILEHTFMNRFWWKFVWMLTLWRLKFIILLSMTTKVIEGHIRSSFYSKCVLLEKFYFCLKFNLIKTINIKFYIKKYMTLKVTYMLWRDFVFSTFRPSNKGATWNYYFFFHQILRLRWQNSSIHQ